MDEKLEKKEENNKPEEESKDTTDGNKYETTPVIERAREERERLETANKKKEELLDREEAIMAKRELGGMSEAGMQAPKPKKLSDEEYAEKVQHGEVNPLKDDGFV